LCEKKREIYGLEFEFGGGKEESNPNPKGGENPNQEQKKENVFGGYESDKLGYYLLIGEGTGIRDKDIPPIPM
jgi:hypothetical protein